MNLVLRLRASGIVAYYNASPATDQYFGGASLVSFGLCQDAEKYDLGDNVIPEIAPPVAGDETTIEDHTRAAQEVDRKVCEMFGITEKIVLVNQATNQIELALVQDRKDGVAARWVKGIGWFN